MLYNFVHHGDEIFTYCQRKGDGVEFTVQRGGEIVWSKFSRYIRSKSDKEAMKDVAQEQHTVAQRLLDEGI